MLSWLVACVLSWLVGVHQRVLSTVSWQNPFFGEGNTIMTNPTRRLLNFHRVYDAIILFCRLAGARTIHVRRNVRFQTALTDVQVGDAHDEHPRNQHEAEQRRARELVDFVL
mgnify:CR=1 FL=1